MDTNITKLVTTKIYSFYSPETKDEFLYNIIEKSLDIEGEDVAIKSWEMFRSIDLKKIVKKRDVFYDNDDYMILGKKVLEKLEDTRAVCECILNFLDNLDIEKEDEGASLETVEEKNRKHTIEDRENNSEENYEFQSKRSCDKHNQQYTTDSKNLNDTINSFSSIESQGQGKNLKNIF